MISKVSTFLGPSGLYSSQGVTPSLVLFLDANNLSSYNGFSGETWQDLSIRHNTGTLNNITPVLNGIPQVAFSFNGTSSFVSFTQSDGIPVGSEQYTIEVWFNADSYDVLGTLIGWGTTATDQSNALRLDSNGFNNYWWFNDLNVSFTGTQSMIVGNWYYVASTYDGTNRKLYLNGELKASDTPSAPNVTDSSTLKIGNFYNSEYFTGKISKVKVSNIALGSSKILSNFNTDKVLHGYVYGSMTFSAAQKSYLYSTSGDYAFGTNDFTVEAFFNATQSIYDYAGIISLRGNSSFSNGVNINLQNSNTSIPSIEFSTAGVYSTYTASTDDWYHVAISRISGTSSLYVNGKLITEIADTTNYGNTKLVIGRYYTDLDDYYHKGLISNIRVINGNGLYSGGEISVPSTPLSPTTNTKFLITSQQTTPTSDLSGLLQTVTASNIGWTSSSPDIYYFKYDDFSSTEGLELVSINSITSNKIYLTSLAPSDVGNVYRTEAINFNRSFSFRWNFECSGGSGADGFCVQWTTTNNTNGGAGGDVSMIQNSSTINAFQFKTYGYDIINWYHSNVQQSSQSITPFTFRQNAYYWMDFNHNTSTMHISYATTNVKPVSPQHTFNGVTFDSGNYYIGFGAANGGSNDYHVLKSMKLIF